MNWLLISERLSRKLVRALPLLLVLSWIASTNAAQAGWPTHIEIHVLDKGRKIYVVNPVDWGVYPRPPLKWTAFGGPPRITYVLAGTGVVEIGKQATIEVLESEIRINGKILSPEVISAIVEADGSVRLNAFVRTFD